MSGAAEADERRAQLREFWERAAAGWGRCAGRVRAVSMPVSSRMLEHLALRPGQRVLELAAGPGDTGFLAAELVQQPDDSVPEGTLVCSDASEAMLEVARARAAEQGMGNVEFARLELEWIDLDAASVDAVICRWGLMFAVDPASAAGEMRRVLRPGGRIALAVWDDPALNPWATISGRALVELGHAQPPDPDAPGMFALASAERLRELLDGAGFLDVVVDAVDVPREHARIDEYIAETLELSTAFREAFERLSETEREHVRARIEVLAAPFTAADGTLRFPGRSLVAAAEA